MPLNPYRWWLDTPTKPKPSTELNRTLLSRRPAPGEPGEPGDRSLPRSRGMSFEAAKMGIPKSSILNHPAIGVSPFIETPVWYKSVNR